MEYDAFGRPRAEEPGAAPRTPERLPAIDSAGLPDAPLHSRWGWGEDAATLSGIAVWRLEHHDPAGDWRSRRALAVFDVAGHGWRSVSWECTLDDDGEEPSAVAFELTDAEERWQWAVGEGRAADGDGDIVVTLPDGREVDVGMARVLALERHEGNLPDELRAAATIADIENADLDAATEIDVCVICDADGRALAQYDRGEFVLAPPPSGARGPALVFLLALWAVAVALFAGTGSALAFAVPLLFTLPRIVQAVRRRKPT